MRPNTNERQIASKAIGLLKRAAKEVDDLNLFLICRECAEHYQTNGTKASAAIELALKELNNLIGVKEKEPVNVDNSDDSRARGFAQEAVYQVSQ
ncbi:hypothetical protein ACFPYJ_21420 [Paenibacillus solisilvae]|uniref:Uncharacterized protein n=1 Tax=Paenibacillus solisilvae TaxID=2486751 RepID=A0ABW0W0F7_9BACL